MYVFRVTVRRAQYRAGKTAKLRVEEFYARAHTWFLLREAVRARFGAAAAVEYALVQESDIADEVLVVVDDKGQANWVRA
ncbi:MAG TPA: hypothetical protein VGS96_09790 [Thermoanaerobaculia bacterium]|jgi:hypothetical protein|nr:hypothetical protein [Thermoanaerobaculia bacterium]